MKKQILLIYGLLILGFQPASAQENIYVPTCLDILLALKTDSSTNCKTLKKKLESFEGKFLNEKQYVGAFTQKNGQDLTILQKANNFLSFLKHSCSDPKARSYLTITPERKISYSPLFDVAELHKRIDAQDQSLAAEIKKSERSKKQKYQYQYFETRIKLDWKDAISYTHSSLETYDVAFYWRVDTRQWYEKMMHFQFQAIVKESLKLVTFHTSNPAGGGNLKTYTWKLPPKKISLKGKIMANGKGVKDVLLKLIDEDNIAVTATTNKKGNYTFEVHESKSYQLEGTLAGYKPLKQTIEGAKKHKNRDFSIESLEPQPKPNPKRALSEDTVPAVPLQDDIVQQKTPPAELDTLIPKNPKSFEGSEVKQDITYILDIYYDLDKATLRPESIIELEKLRIFLMQHPDYLIEVAAYADARGSEQHNLYLSKQRAEGVRNWLIQKGIQAKQLQAVGQGESALVYPCPDNVPCLDVHHQMNRRTEFKWIGYVHPNPIKISVPQKK